MTRTSSPLPPAADDLLATPLFNLPEPVIAVHPQFTARAPVTLHLRERWGPLAHDDFVIREVPTGEVVFRVKATLFSIGAHKALVDAPTDETIAHLRQEAIRFRPAFHASWDKAGNKPIFRLKATHAFVRTSMELEFRNRMTDQRVRAGLTGDWRARAALLWLDQGNGQELPVARIHRPTADSMGRRLRPDEYYVDIAANVDRALVVLICIALDETKCERRTALRL